MWASASKPMRLISSMWKLRLARAHAADVERERGLGRQQPRLDVVGDRAAHHGHADLEAGLVPRRATRRRPPAGTASSRAGASRRRSRAASATFFGPSAPRRIGTSARSGCVIERKRLAESPRARSVVRHPVVLALRTRPAPRAAAPAGRSRRTRACARAACRTAARTSPRPPADPKRRARA